ncbi:DUF427 domain-containing protein [Qingshengfaniella alkalisoli]|uniref:DUF427 domain-containing protein n=2 Tax=Qingshengfaniella alkalisoli TaxID=2599296 RepID=A0A5B8IXB6_9RHOB|nr:DUF427 domain-containing protein [Qingshengfaniella alkalisoli]
MERGISTRPAGGTWVVRAGGAIIAETSNAIELIESGLSPVIYFPRDDVAMAFLDQTDQATRCAFKGNATYYAIHTKSKVLDNAAWSYETPLDNAADIAGHIAFYQSMVTVERV